jgi:hypothetical protein
VTRTTTTRLIAERIPNLSSRKRLALNPRLDLDIKSLAFIFKEINALKRQLKPEETASSKKRKVESILSNEMNLTTRSDEGEEQEYVFTLLSPLV